MKNKNKMKYILSKFNLNEDKRKLLNVITVAGLLNAIFTFKESLTLEVFNFIHFSAFTN